MSKRHTLVTLVLLSSSTAFAKPAKHHRSPPLIVKIERVCKRFRVECDLDGFPMVGNVKGKGGSGREDDEAMAALDPHYISRIFSR
jgi:hypothetical protein